MNIQVRTDNHLEGSAELNNYITETLIQDLNRFSNAITRVEVHFTDENGDKKKAKDKRCVLEARVANHQPVVVTHHANNLSQAFDGASTKLIRALETMAGRMTTHDSPKFKYSYNAT